MYFVLMRVVFTSSANVRSVSIPLTFSAEMLFQSLTTDISRMIDRFGDAGGSFGKQITLEIVAVTFR
jgi:hypothetical protein